MRDSSEDFSISEAAEAFWEAHQRLALTTQRLRAAERDLDSAEAHLEVTATNYRRLLEASLAALGAAGG